VVTHEIRSEIIRTIKSGESLQEIARGFSLSQATIDRICNEQPKLHEMWRAARHERMKNTEREKFELLIKNNPNMTRVELRQTKNSGYSWLSRHDKEWLNSRLPVKMAPLIRPKAKRRPGVDWVMRDQECLAAIKAIEATLRFETWERMKPRAVLRRIQNLSFIPRLDRLPESRERVMQILAGGRGRLNK
jgi:hypothetical protein